MTSQKILVFGAFSNYGKSNTCCHRLEAMEKEGYALRRVETLISGTFVTRLAGKLFRLGFPVPYPGSRRVMQAISALPAEDSPWLIWIDKGLLLSDACMKLLRRRFPKAKIAGYSPDDMGQRHNQSQQFLRSLPYYDIFFTTKSYNVAELTALGARHVVFVGNSYQDMLHRPLQLDADDRRKYAANVAFIGSYEHDRAQMIGYLGAHGVEVDIWGSNWSKHGEMPGVRIRGGDLEGEEYVKAICAADIVLCFLRKINRDLQTTRSVEIPACGAFMLAERTDEHQSLFAEGKEAEFFSSPEELLDKCVRYLHDNVRRHEIARAGLTRCRESGYSNRERIKSMIQMCETVLPGDCRK